VSFLQCIIANLYQQDCPQGKVANVGILDSSDVDFSARMGATRCTDGVTFGVEVDQCTPNFTLIGVGSGINWSTGN